MLSLTLQFLFDLRFKQFIFGLFGLDLSIQLVVYMLGSEEPGEKADDQTPSCSIYPTKSSTYSHAFQCPFQGVLTSL